MSLSRWQLAGQAGTEMSGSDRQLSRSPLRGQLLAVVVEDRRVTGLVTTEELRLALLHARLRSSQPAGNGW